MLECRNAEKTGLFILGNKMSTSSLFISYHDTKNCIPSGIKASQNKEFRVDHSKTSTISFDQ